MKRPNRDVSEQDDSTPRTSTTPATNKPLPRSLRQQRIAALSPTPEDDKLGLDDLYEAPANSSEPREQARTSPTEPDTISVAAHRPSLLPSGKRPAEEMSGGPCASEPESRGNKKSGLPTILRRDTSNGRRLVLDRGMNGDLSAIPVSRDYDDGRAQVTFHGLPMTPDDESLTGYTSGGSPEAQSMYPYTQF
jgi:hypothetical protein